VLEILSNIVLPIFLAAMMFSLGLALTPGDFGRVVRYPKALIVGFLSLFVLVPLIGMAIGHLAASAPALAVGVFLISTCPGGTFSNLLTFWGRGDLALSISMTAVASVLYVFLAPIWIAIGYSVFMGGSEAVNLAPVDAIISIGRVSLAPVVAGMLVRAYLPRFRSAIEGYIRNISSIVIVAIFLALMWSERETLSEAIGLIWPVVIFLNIVMVCAAYALSRFFGFDRPRVIALVCEHAIRQEGIAIYIAVSLLSQPTMALPLLLNSATGFAVGMLFIALARRFSLAPAAAQDADGSVHAAASSSALEWK